MQRTRTLASAALLAGVATVGMTGVASAGTVDGDHSGSESHGSSSSSHDGHGSGDRHGSSSSHGKDRHDRTGLVSGVASGVGGLAGGAVDTVGNLLGADVAGPLLDGVL